jgi:hypothetical protein
MKKLTLFSLLLIACFKLVAQDLYSFENSARFTDYLILSGRYTMAAAEMERLVFLKPDSLQLKTALLDCYALDQNYEAIERRSLQFPSQGPMHDTLFFNYRVWASLKQQSGQLNAQLKTSYAPVSENARKYYLSWQALLMNDVSSAIKFVPRDALHIPEVKALNETCLKASNIKRKSPALAACMSGIIPGSGKWYAGERKDAVIGFISIGMMAYQAFRGFKKDGTSSVYGWISASLGAGFYLGNIYGSSRSAKRYNERQFKTIIPDIENNFKRFPISAP